MSIRIGFVTYMTPIEFANHRRCSLRMIRSKLAAGRIEGAMQLGGRYGAWLIPSNALVVDGRATTGKWIGYRLMRKMQDKANSM